MGIASKTNAGLYQHMHAFPSTTATVSISLQLQASRVTSSNRHQCTQGQFVYTRIAAKQAM